MKIKQIKLNNIGPYVDNNTFDFDVNDSIKRLVLIGGKNGAGKTTLFNAIKICLYGCTAYGYEANNANYYDKIEKIINTNAKINRTAEASIELKMLLDDGKYDDIYTFNRSWRIAGKRIVESFVVYKNDQILTETEKSDFESYLLQLLPPNLFKFYFFDGEKLNDFVFSGNKETDFKDAFLKLCSLDTIDIIKNNFARVTRSRLADSSDIISEYDAQLNLFNDINSSLSLLEEEYKSLENEIISIEEEMAMLDKEYSKGGGISKKEWRAMESQISKEELKREEYRRWLKDIANNILPFIILKEQLISLKDRIISESKIAATNNLKESISSKEVSSLIMDVLVNYGIMGYSDITSDIIDAIKGYATEKSEEAVILNLSESDKYDITSKINDILSFDIEKIKKATVEIDESLERVKQIRKKMERSNTDDYDVYLQKKMDMSEQKAKITQELLRKERNIAELQDKHSVVKSKLAKAKSNYEQAIKKKSVNDISSRALLAFEELQNVLYEKSVRIVEENFKKNFNNLINKSDLIDGIHIDSNLNVLPYKNKNFERNEILKVIAKNGKEYLISQIGIYAYEILTEKLKTEERVFELPVEVNQQLSAGEKQIFIMALYKSLSQLNKINVPYIIDTPFARIDKEHRNNILKNFFLELKGQMIILSTDEELVGEYKDTIDDMISNTYVLRHMPDGSTRVEADCYFGGDL